MQNPSSLTNNSLAGTITQLAADAKNWRMNTLGNKFTAVEEAWDSGVNKWKSFITYVKDKTDTIDWANISTLLSEIGTNVISTISTKTTALRSYFDTSGDGKVTIDDLKGIFHISTSKQGMLKNALGDLSGAIRTNVYRLFNGFVTKWMGS